MTMVSLKNGKKESGEVVLVRELIKSGKTGVLAEGVYEGFKPNKFNTAKNDYFIRGTDDKLYIINESASVREQFAQLDGIPSVKVKLVYSGKKNTKAGRQYHDFELFADVTVAGDLA